MKYKYDDYGIPEKETCPSCCGIGYNIDNLDHECVRCSGTGEIYIEEDESASIY